MLVVKVSFSFVQLKSQAKQNITASHHVFESHVTSTFYHKGPFELKETSMLFILSSFDRWISGPSTTAKILNFVNLKERKKIR